MKRTLTAFLFSASIALAAPAPAPAPAAMPADDGKGEKLLGILDTEQVKIDLRAIEAAKGDFGLEYQFDFGKKFIDHRKTLRFWEASLSGKGFLVTDPDKNTHDSLITQASFTFSPLYRIDPPAAPKRSTWDDGPGAASGPDWTAIRRARERAAEVQSPFWLYANGHAKWETTQDGDDQALALGVSIAATTSFLNKVLDAPFRQLRWGKNGETNNARHLDISASYDYVTARSVSDPTASDDDKNRLACHAEWETGIFQNDRIAFSFTGHYDLDGADQAFHHFFEAKYLHLLIDTPGAKTSFAIKYTTGELPPTYKKGDVLGAGFAIEF